ncbi:hypothetical protein GCM10022243_48820 [Saccharothrix violaceirubra]|uniref:Uncharacterized protein n=1 Tax=Saccharothrix violaceirubra TaxID=413306 RepID=A0A7W7SZZ0_9PSEU|nr:hypothetical protein [Saccharothrix violaceirubra]MBB4963776.1 hypothetical protein [Saccharothrix violaceirubra]
MRSDRPVGNRRDAASAALGYHDYDDHDISLMLHDDAHEDDPRLHKRLIGRGERCVAWLIDGVVYKVGRDAGNRYEHEALTAWRQAGAPWAPPTTLWTVLDEWGFECVVVAMPYLPDSGAEVDPARLAAIRQAAPQTCRDNYADVDGHLWLIDGGDIEHWPVPGSFPRPGQVSGA